MKVLLLLPLVACATAHVIPYGAYVSAPWAPAAQYHAQDNLGQVSFGHSALDQSRSEVRLWNGQVLGHYSYIDANGEPAITYYEAGPNGYRVLGANNLPEANADVPSVPEYTPEVAAARAEFAQKFEEAKAAAAAAAPAEPVVEAAAEPALAVEAEAAPEVAVEAAAEEVVPETEAVEVARKKRQIVLPALAPALAKTTVETKQYEPVEAAVPADTTKIDLTTKEHEVLTYTHTPFVSTGFVAPQVTLKTNAGLPLAWGGYPYFPFIGAPAAAEASRKKREVEVPLPFLHAVPTTTKVSYTTSHFEPQEAATPADTVKIGQVTKEHEYTIPSVRYVQPTAKIQPITYKTVAMPFAINPFMTTPVISTTA
ncbi:uncharacterized protein LOC143032259 [Oratosquilla oratoria]|uniref:uncharacterized protein LOC143032259 n=1 Tax=Oratosquilla oratoria TaxID=337810 RepID=UPI003F764AD1